MEPQNNEKKSWKDFFQLGEVFNYYFRKKKQEEGKDDINLKMMHVINIIAVIMFLFALILWIIKRF